mmetsp:Transcript_75449/g.211527  ORF Transcript_75449/g.211527 Transcript_75449/m.211527 type:complete len:231 (+) Transcript_75449:938-1630(+)
MPILLGEFATGRDGSKVNGLKDQLVHGLGLFGFKGILHHHKGIRQSLNTNSNGSVTHVGILSLGDGVVVAVNDLVKVAGDHHGNFLELVVVKDGLSSSQSFHVLGSSHQLGQTDTGQVAHGRLIRSSVLHDFSAQVTASNRSQVLLVALGVGRVLVEHVRSSGFDLRVQNGKPQLLGLDSLSTLSFPFITLVQFDKLLSMAIGESGTFIGAHQRPGTVGLDTLHEQVRNP